MSKKINYRHITDHLFTDDVLEIFSDAISESYFRVGVFHGPPLVSILVQQIFYLGYSSRHFCYCRKIPIVNFDTVPCLHRSQYSASPPVTNLLKKTGGASCPHYSQNLYELFHHHKGGILLPLRRSPPLGNILVDTI